MSGLAGLLSDPQRLIRRVKQSAPEPKALRRVVNAIAGEGGEEVAVVDVATIQSSVFAAAAEGRLNDLSRRELREGCRYFLHPPNPPGRSPEVSRALVDQVSRLHRRAALFALIDTYLDRFNSADADLIALAARLHTITQAWPWRPTDVWDQRAMAFELFDPREAPARIAAKVLQTIEPIPVILAQAGLNTEGRRKGGLAEAAFVHACRQVAVQPAHLAEPQQRRVLEWARQDGLQLNFPMSWPNFALALFRPWRSDEPSGEFKATLIDAATGYAGDPRIQESRWRQVRDVAGEAYEVIIRWLTKASVEQFFDIVAQTTDRPDMWAERRRFWTNYLEKDLISAAWVAFGADGAWRAENAARRSSDKGLSMFGRLASGGGRTAEHAALIMRMGDVTVVEWSHNGKWNLWRKGDGDHPALFRHNTIGRADYHPHDLMYGPISGSHVSGWQYTVQDAIWTHAGVRP